MAAIPAEAPFCGPLAAQRKRFSNLRSVIWRIDLGILPNSPSSSVDDLRRVAADTRRSYASLRRQLLVDLHLTQDGSRSDIVMDNPLSQNPESSWGRFFKNAELEKMVDHDLSRLYPEDGSYFQTSACQTMLRRVLLVWCLRHPEYGYRQGMHELLAPLVYVLHVDLCHLSDVRDLYEHCFKDDFDEMPFRDIDPVSNYRSGSEKKTDICRRPVVRSLDELDQDTRDIFYLSDFYGAEGELGVILSERFMEHDAYCMFNALMSGANGVVAMAEYFSPAVGSSTGLPPIIEASSALYHVLSRVDSSLHSHLVDLGVEPQYFALRWLRILFGREFCLDDLLVIWDELFSCPNGTCIDGDTDYNFKILCSPRGALIAAFAVSMLLQLRNSLLATENPTSCLQRLLNFPQNSELLKKLIEKAKALHSVALDSNVLSSSSQQISVKNKLTVSRGYSLPSHSPKTPVSPAIDSYWEEQWRVLHNDKEIQKGSNDETNSKKTVKKLLIERLGLSRAGSLPTSVTGVAKESRSSARRRLLNEFNPAEDLFNSEPESLALEVSDIKEVIEELADENIVGRTSGCTVDDVCLSAENASTSSLSSNSQGNDHEESEKSSLTSNSFVAEDLINSEPDIPAAFHSRESLPIEVSDIKEVIEELADENIIDRTSGCTIDACSSGENTSTSSISSHSQGNDHEESEKSSLASNSFVYNDEISNMEDPFQTPLEDCKDILSANPKPEKGREEARKDGNSVMGKFQWLWMFGKSRESQYSSRHPDSRNIKGYALNTSEICEVSRKLDMGEKKVMGTLKNLGQSMLEHIQVIESVFQQERGKSGSSDNFTSNVLGPKGQATATAALKELRKISNLLLEL